MKRILGIVALLALCAPVLANDQFPTPTGQFVPGEHAECMDALSHSVSCALADVGPWAVTVTKPNVAPSVNDRAQVVAISPNSRGPGTPVSAVATGTTGAVAATLAATQGKTNYVCGVSVSPGSAGTAITLQLTLVGVIGGTMTWAVGAPVTAVGTTGTIFTQNFNPCLPASAANTAIVMNSSALGTSGINNDVQVWGYVQ